jgi:hypothetical protein
MRYACFSQDTFPELSFHNPMKLTAVCEKTFNTANIDYSMGFQGGFVATLTQACFQAYHSQYSEAKGARISDEYASPRSNKQAQTGSSPDRINVYTDNNSQRDAIAGTYTFPENL